MKKIGFVGVGIMGKSMVRNLMKNRYEVSIYTRTKSKAADVIKEGALWKDSAADCASGAQAVITMVGYPSDVREVYFGENGILNHARAGSYVIDMTTSSPELSREIYEAAAAKEIHALDAPVSGGDTGAADATLSIMAGGDREAYEACLPLFEAMGKTIHYAGPAGYGQHVKMANQIAISGALAGVCEAVAYAEGVGLDPRTMLGCISAGAAGSWQMSNMAPKMLKGDFAPGFFAKHFIKDMKIAAEEAQKTGLDLCVLRDVLNMFEQLAGETPPGDFGTQALLWHYEKQLKKQKGPAKQG